METGMSNCCSGQSRGPWRWIVAVLIFVVVAAIAALNS
jgi:hypothetical protein